MTYDLLKQILQDSPLTEELIHDTGDGRLDSALSEKVVINHLKAILPDIDITEAPARYWYDVAIQEEGKFFPINIKITSGTSADNVSSKKGMYYALTGIRPEEEKGLDKWETFIQKLTCNYRASDADYYFIIRFKDTGELLFTSLKHLETLVANGNNLPFQCNWGQNKCPTTRSQDEQLRYIMDTFISSYIKRSPGLDLLVQWRSENE
jgi:hypothetical protein